MALSTRKSQGLPPWLRRRIPFLSESGLVEATVARHELHTVCKEALCPNRAECYESKRVTFIILGDRCTRNCSFCSVKKGSPRAPDPDEPERCAKAARDLGLHHVIVTSVTRDDLGDGGAEQFASTIRALKALPESPIVEVLIPDFAGDIDSLFKVLEEGPDILGHNIETVRRLYPYVRKGADFDRSLGILSEAKRARKEVITKSALMLGLGETVTEVREALRDLRDANCDHIAIGQYLRPGLAQVPVEEYIPPWRFELVGEEARRMGFLYVQSGPLVRSSYRSVAATRTHVQVREWEK